VRLSDDKRDLAFAIAGSEKIAGTLKGPGGQLIAVGAARQTPGSTSNNISSRVIPRLAQRAEGPLQRSTFRDR